MDTQYLSWQRSRRAARRRLAAVTAAILLVAAALAVPLATRASAPAAGAGTGGTSAASTTGTIATYTGAVARLTQLYDPYGLATDGTYLYVVDAGRDRIVKYLAKTLAFVRAYGSSGTGKGRFQAPTAIAVEGGYAYVTDSTNRRVVRIATKQFDGTGWKTFDVQRKSGEIGGSLGGIAVSAGWVYVTYEKLTTADTMLGYVARFDARRLDGTGWKAYHGGSPSDQGMQTPGAIAVVGSTAYVAGDDDVVSFASDLSGKRWTRMSTYVHDSAVRISDATGIAAIGGHLYVAGMDLVVADIPFRKGGSATRLYVPFGSQGGVAAIGSRLYTTDLIAGRLYAVDPRVPRVLASSGTGVGMALDQLYGPWDVAYVPDGAFVFDGSVPVERGYGSQVLKVLKLSTDGTLTRLAAVEAPDGAYGEVPGLYAAGDALALLDIGAEKVVAALSTADLSPLAMTQAQLTALVPTSFWDGIAPIPPACPTLDATKLAAAGYTGAQIAGATCGALTSGLVQVTFNDGAAAAVVRVVPTTGAWLIVRRMADGAPWISFLGATATVVYLSDGPNVLTLDPTTLAGDCPLPFDSRLVDLEGMGRISATAGAPGTLYVTSTHGPVVFEMGVYADTAACAAAAK